VENSRKEPYGHYEEDREAPEQEPQRSLGGLLARKQAREGTFRALRSVCLLLLEREEVMSPLDRFKIVERDRNGKVVQIHEVYRSDIPRKVMALLETGNALTITSLKE
jgi:hypothetical protein